MNILIDIGHPGHVHLFKNFYKDFKAIGHEIKISVRQIQKAIELLRLYNIPYLLLGDKSDTLRGKFIRQFLYDIKLRQIVNENSIDLAIGSSITIAHVSKISRVKSIVLDDDDDEVQPLMTNLGHPFADLVISPDTLKNKRKKKDVVYYAGYHELAYLHPNRFSPDPNVLNDAGIHGDDKFFILRFNSFKAHHDLGVSGFSLENKRKLIKILLQYGKVLITTEREIDEEFSQYKISISPDKIHSLMAYSAMFIGDSQTMTSEAAVLGIPSIRCNSFAGKISYLEEEERKYGLTFGFRPDQSDKMFEKIKELLNNPNLKEEWQEKRKKLLADKIDVTAFLVWFVENYPESVKVMREKPEFQFRF